MSSIADPIAYLVDAHFLCPDCAFDAEHETEDDLGAVAVFGGHESDSPQHCDECDVLLDFDLTEDGAFYVLEAIIDKGWDEGTVVEWYNRYRGQVVDFAQGKDFVAELLDALVNFRAGRRTK